MDIITGLLPHVFWCVTAVLVVFRVVGKQNSERQVAKIWTQLSANQAALESSLSVAKEMTTQLARLQSRLDKLEQPQSRKVNF